MILLTDEEMARIWAESKRDENTHKNVAKAQLKKVVEFIKSEEQRAFTYIGEGVHLIQIPESSWQSLLKEIE